MEVWILMIFLAGKTVVPLAGEYQNETRCMTAAKMQLVHWQQTYGLRVYWKCVRTSVKAS